MKKYLVLLWMLLPVPVLVFHYAEGRELLELDAAHDHVRLGESAERAGDMVAAEKHYREAVARVPADRADLRLRIGLSVIRTSARTGGVVAALDDAEKMLSDEAFATMPATFRDEARETLSRIHYHAAWVMRLEGANRELWMESAEQARQGYRALVENGLEGAAAPRVRAAKEDLESAVTLQRLSYGALIARPLPEEGKCMGNCNLSEKMNERRKRRGKKGVGKPDGNKPSPGAGAQRYVPQGGS